MKIRIVKSENKWYNIGEEFEVARFSNDNSMVDIENDEYFMVNNEDESLVLKSDCEIIND
jgi:hypothetical protein